MRIIVIAPFSEDHVSVDGAESVQPGGPALFIGDSLRSLGANTEAFAGSHPAVVRIIIENGKERGELVSSSPILTPKCGPADGVIISTVGTEFSLDKIPTDAGFIALDVQGYARSPAGREQLAASARSFDCVKATEAEVSLLDQAFVARQKQREFIVTRGSRGATVWAQGVAHDIPVRAVKVSNPLGAGDRFLAAYVVGRLRGLLPPSAAAFASEHVSDHLSTACR